MPPGAVAVPGRRVPASSGPNLPGPRTGAAAAPRAQLRCAARGVPVLAASLHGAGSRFQGRRPRRPWHTWRSELLSETLACACMHGCAATRLGAEQWISRWSIHTSERDLQVV